MLQRILLLLLYLTFIGGCFGGVISNDYNNRSYVVTSNFNDTGAVVFRVTNIGSSPLKIPNDQLSEQLVSCKFETEDGKVKRFKPVIALRQISGYTLLQKNEVFERSFNVMRAFRDLREESNVQRIRLHWNSLLSYSVNGETVREKIKGVTNLY